MYCFPCKCFTSRTRLGERRRLVDASSVESSGTGQFWAIPFTHILRANGSVCHRRQSVQLSDPTVRARVDDGHRLIFVDSANVALREFVARDIRRGELRVSTRHRCAGCACSVTQDSRIQVDILGEQHLFDDSHVHLSVARFATREEQTTCAMEAVPVCFDTNMSQR